MTHFEFLERRIEYHTQRKKAAKKRHIKDRHQKRIRYFEGKLKKAQMLDLIGGTHGRL